MSSRTLYDDDFDAWFQAIMDEPAAEQSLDAAGRKRGDRYAALPSSETRAGPVGEAGIKIAGDPAPSYDDIINALGELFSDPRAGDPEFGEEIYARAKPLFKAAIALLRAEKQLQKMPWPPGECAKTIPAPSRPHPAPRLRGLTSRSSARRPKRKS